MAVSARAAPRGRTGRMRSHCAAPLLTGRANGSLAGRVPALLHAQHPTNACAMPCAHDDDPRRLCWRFISNNLGTNRTSKQCREHFLNSLTPDTKKGCWELKGAWPGRCCLCLAAACCYMRSPRALVVALAEEYLIAKEHSRVGSHWCIIARSLPGRCVQPKRCCRPWGCLATCADTGGCGACRTDNAIKNFYNATVRSKAVRKYDSILVSCPAALLLHGQQPKARLRTWSCPHTLWPSPMRMRLCDCPVQWTYVDRLKVLPDPKEAFKAAEELWWVS